jgi:hypothetical protein
MVCPGVAPFSEKRFALCTASMISLWAVRCACRSVPHRCGACRELRGGPALCDTRVCASPCAGPVPRSGLVSEDVGEAVRHCARAVRRTTERARRQCYYDVLHWDRELGMRVR